MKAIKFIAVVALAMFATTSYGQKFGSVKQNEILQKMVVKDSVDTKMQAYQTELQETFNALQTEYETKSQDLQKKLSTYSETVLQQKQKDLNRVLQGIQEFEQLAPQEIQKKQQELMTPVIKKFSDAVEAIGKEGGYTMVLDASQPLYINPAVVTDLTSVVTKKLELQ